MLGQQATAEKSNEIKAIPLRLERLQLAGALVTIDAMGCQTAIAQKVLDCGADYRLHWVLDVVFHDDLMRLRTANRPKNIATVKHMALSLIKSAPGKVSIRVKRKAAGWGDAFLRAITQRQAQ